MRAPIGQLLVCCGRIAAAVLLLTAAVYELLASIPFAYYHFLQFAHFSWLPYVIRFHPVIMSALTIRGVTGRQELSNRTGRSAVQTRARRGKCWDGKALPSTERV